MKRFKLLIPFILVCLMFLSPAQAGINDRFSDIELGDSGDTKNAIILPERAAPSGNPVSNWGWLYVKDLAGASALYFENDAGAVSQLTPSATAYDDIGDPDANGVILFTTYTNIWTMAATAGDAFNIQGTGAFGDISVVRIEQKTGNPTDGTVLEVVAADPNVDPLVISASGKANALVVGQNTGVVTIAGVAEGTSALVITAGDISLTDGDLNVPGGDATFAEDVTIGGWLNLTGDLIGGVGLINYTNFDVDAAGNVTAVDGTFSGNMSVVGTFQQDALSAKTADTTLTINGTGTGGVSIGTVAGTGAITLGGGGFATAVTLPTTVDLTLAGGSISVTDTANTDTVAVTNNTMTTADLVQLTAGGTRTSGNVINISDSATTASSISVTANALTTGSLLYLDSDRFEAGAPAGYYIQAYDGNSIDFSVGDEGKTVIDGVAATDVLTINAGDLQMTTGDIGVDDGIIVVANDADEGNKISRNDATGTAAVLEIEETHATGGINLLLDTKNTTAAEYNLDMTSAGATQIHFTASGAAADGMLIDVTDSYTGQGIVADLGPWLGTTGEGFISITSDPGAINEVGQAIRVNLQGTGTAGTAVTGKALFAHSNAAIKAGESLVYLDTLTNTALHIKNDGVAADGILIEAKDAYTGQGIVGDMGAWVGTVSEGFINIQNDAAATDVAGMALRINLQDSLVDTTAISGKGIFVKEVSPVKAGTYVAHFESTSNGSISAIGPALFADSVTVNGAQLIGDGATEQVGFIRDIVDGAAGTPITVTIAQSGTIFTNSQATEFDLPAAATGLEYTFVVNHASNLHIDPDNADNFSYIGCAAGDRLLSATVGDSITIVGIAAGTWAVKSVVAGDGSFADTVWTDAN